MISLSRGFRHERPPAVEGRDVAGTPEIGGLDKKAFDAAPIGSGVHGLTI